MLITAKLKWYKENNICDQCLTVYNYNVDPYAHTCKHIIKAFFGHGQKKLFKYYHKVN